MIKILKFNKIKYYLLLMRFHKPTGIYLLLLPCLWSLAIIDRNILNLKFLIIFIIGSVVTRAMGCIINDLIDRNIDKEVLRTKDRPLASGKISTFEAIYLIIILAFIALIIALNLNKASMHIILIAPIMITLYPFMKRITYFPQIFLGITFNLGVLIAGCVNKSNIELSNFLLYIASIFWTIGYDTIYAHQDKYYDKKLGLKSTALFIIDHQKYFISICYIFMILFTSLSASNAKLNYIFHVLLISILLWFLYKLNKLDLNSPEACGCIFKLNTIYGLFILGAIIVSNQILIDNMIK